MFITFHRMHHWRLGKRKKVRLAVLYIFQQHSIRPLSWHITLSEEPMGISGIAFFGINFCPVGNHLFGYQFVKLGTGHDHMIVHVDLSWRHLPESKRKLRLAVLGDRRPRNSRKRSGKLGKLATWPRRVAERNCSSILVPAYILYGRDSQVWCITRKIN